MTSFVEVTCPFCGEDDFDLYGLKIHILSGWCEVFNNTEEDEALARRKAQRILSLQKTNGS